MNFFTLSLYGLGTIRGFTDSAQILLLALSRIFGFSLAINGLCGVAADLWLGIRYGSLRFIPGIALYLIFGLLGALTAVFAGFIIVLTGGTGG
jgi:hypothetical protein